MRYWLVRTNAQEVKIDRGAGTLLVAGKRLPKVEMGDQLILADTAKSEFTATTTVTQIAPAPELSFSENRAFVASTESWRAFKDPPSFDLLRYSLSFVRRPDSKSATIGRGIRSLTEDDALTILEGEPFVARTAYFELASALPEELRRDFEREVATTVHTYADKFRLLQLFIRTRILSVGETLIALEAAIQRLAVRTKDRQRPNHVFGADDTPSAHSFKRARYDSVFAQASAFRELLKSLVDRESIEQGLADLREADVFNELVSELSEPNRRPSEERFERVFGSELA
jgi:hypothetical protein